MDYFPNPPLGCCFYWLQTPVTLLQDCSRWTVFPDVPSYCFCLDTAAPNITPQHNNCYDTSTNFYHFQQNYQWCKKKLQVERKLSYFKIEIPIWSSDCKQSKMIKKFNYPSLSKLKHYNTNNGQSHLTETVQTSFNSKAYSHPMPNGTEAIFGRLTKMEF